jgi:O-acetylhomoserine (thiol)-lyase
MPDYRIDTKCIQEGWKPKSGEARVLPIYQSTTFKYDTAADLAKLFDLKAPGYLYSRLANPTVSVLEKKMSEMEGGVDAIGLSSGQAAVLFAVLNVASMGDNVVSCSSIYGGVYNLFNTTLRKYGIETRFFSMDDSAEKIEKLVDEKTKVIYGETISNPTLVMLDFDKLAAIAKKYGIMFIVDNTLATPALCRPLDLGANAVVYSTTKYIEGHATCLGGMVVDGGNFDFKKSKRYNDFNTPDESYHGIVYSDYGNMAYTMKMRAQLVRDFGAIMSPETAFLTNFGCETLALRMEKHCANARKVAAFLAKNDKIDWVNYPSLENNKYFKTAQKYMPNGQGGMMSFGVKGGVKKACKFMESLKMIDIVTHVADIRSCVLHPASTTHRQLSKEQLEAAGIPENLIRLSVGIENADDIIADIKQALEKI